MIFYPLSSDNLLVERRKKIFILGASGTLGYHLVRHLSTKFLVAGACFSRQMHSPGAQLFPVDMQKGDVLETLIRVQAPDVVINALGISDPKILMDQSKLADAINVMLPVSIAILASKMRAKFIQLSCAEVYDGSDGNYREDETDFTLHHTIGKQKLAAESYIRAQTMESTTIRLGRVVGMGHPERPSEFDTVRMLLAKGKTIESSQKRVESYLSARSFGEAMEALILEGFPGKHRLYNLGGPSISEYDFRRGWAELVGLGRLIKPATDDSKRNISVQTTAFTSAFPKWQPPTKAQVYLDLLESLSPGIGAKKWQKTLQTL